MKNKSKRIRLRCQHRATGRSWSFYKMYAVWKDGTEVYRCKECGEREDREYERLCRVVANEKKQREYSDKLYWERASKKQRRRLRSRREGIWDDMVRKELCRGVKDWRIKNYIRENAPIELIRLKRALMKLERLIDEVKRVKNQNNARIKRSGD